MFNMILRNYYQSTAVAFSAFLVILSQVLALPNPLEIKRMPWILNRFQFESFEDRNQVCNTESCIKDEKLLNYYLNKSVDPCEDFYAFACGGWLQKEHLPDSEPSWDTFNILQQKINNQIQTLLDEPITETDNLPIRTAKRFYNSCKNEGALETAGATPLHNLLRDLHGWPIVSRYWFEDEFNFQEMMTSLFKNFGIEPLVNIAIESDLKNQTRNMIYVNQVSPLFPLSILNDPQIYTEQIKAYCQWIMNVASELNYEDVSVADIKRDAFEIVNFEIELAKLCTPSELTRDLNSLYNKMTIAHLQEFSDESGQANDVRIKIDWLKYMVDIFNGTGITITSAQNVIVLQPNFVHDLVTLIDKTDKRVLANYMLWRVVAKYGKETTKAFRRYSDAIDQVLIGVKEGLSRTLECQSQTNKLFGKAVGYQYIKKYFDEQTRHKVFELTSFIHDVFVNELKSLEWMDEETKRLAVEKARAMTAVIGYTAEYKNLTQMDIEYAKVNITNDHFQNVLFMDRHSVITELNELTQNDTKENWDMEPTDINAGYSTTNVIFILAGILQFPFYEKNRLQAMNFGSIGSIIGHEITHAFDDVGRQFDKDGNLVQWWSHDTFVTYTEKVQCFIEQFNNYRIPEADAITQTNTTINGVRTQGENIADSGGVNQAFRAYLAYVGKHGADKRLPGDLKRYTPEQLFFISYATNWCEIQTNEELTSQVLKDEHSPNKYRVLGSLSNSHYFAKAFKCPKDSPMNPTKKCQLW